MSRIGVEISIDVTKIDKEKLYKGKKGTYLTATAFIDLGQQDQYGNNGMVTQKVNQDEQQQGVKGAILGNTKVFWSDDSNNQAQSQQNNFQQAQFNHAKNIADEDVPF